MLDTQKITKINFQHLTHLYQATQCDPFNLFMFHLLEKVTWTWIQSYHKTSKGRIWVDMEKNRSDTLAHLVSHTVVPFMDDQNWSLPPSEEPRSASSQVLGSHPFPVVNGNFWSPQILATPI